MLFRLIAEAGSFPINDFNLKINVEIQPMDHHLRVDGELINVADQPARAIDLGFALPILHDPNGQALTWNYDVSNTIDLQEALTVQNGLDATFPFTFPGQIDMRPACTSKRFIPNTKVAHFHNLKVSAYPISSLDLNIQSVQSTYGLGFGDALNDSEEEKLSMTPSISHFGYWVAQPDDTASFLGYYFVEFNIGLLEGDGQSTDFSFIIFRTDDEDFEETSSFREGLQKFQRDIYPNHFNRPTLTPDEDWLFGGGFYGADHQDGGNWSGFDDAPLDYGLRYTQTGEFGQTYLEWCAGKGLGVQVYDRPWAGTFFNDFNNPESDKNIYAKLVSERDTYVAPVPSIYNLKRERVLSIPPGSQDIFSRKPYGFPMQLSDEPYDSNNSSQDHGGPLVVEELSLLTNAYNSGQFGDGLSGIQLDNTLIEYGKANHLDIAGNDMQAFADAGGRLTYSFNHFEPAIPQVCTNLWFLPHLQNGLEWIDESGNGGDNLLNSVNNETEIVSINANEDSLGALKYAMMNSDVIGFESNLATIWISRDHDMYFRRSLARDKSVARKLTQVPCLDEALNTIFDQAGNATGQEMWTTAVDFFDQLVDEAGWLSLAWGFHPSPSAMFKGIIDGYLGGDDRFDRLAEVVIHPLYVPGTPQNNVGFTEVFRQLHLAGWQPITNVVNIGKKSANAPGEPLELYIERFGPFEGFGSPSGRPVYISVLNNDGMSLTMTDVVNCTPAIPLDITEMKTDLDLEISNICQDKYAEIDEYVVDKKEMVVLNGQNKKKNFLLEISNPVALGLDNYNLWGMQLIGHDHSADAVNSPNIVADDLFGKWGTPYTVIPYEGKVRIGGPRTISNPIQQESQIEDKALMVFKVWVENTVNNDGIGGGRGAEENSYYQVFGNWSRMPDETAVGDTVDVIASTDLDASALFSIDIRRSGLYDLRVSYPDEANGTSNACYEVYLVERTMDETGETESVGAEPVLTALVDQSNRETEAMDEDGFISIGEVDVALAEGIDEVTVVVRVSSGGAERRSGQATLLMADAVKLEEIGL